MEEGEEFLGASLGGNFSRERAWEFAEVGWWSLWRAGVDSARVPEFKKVKASRLPLTD